MGSATCSRTTDHTVPEANVAGSVIGGRVCNHAIAGGTDYVCQTLSPFRRATFPPQCSTTAGRLVSSAWKENKGPRAMTRGDAAQTEKQAR